MGGETRRVGVAQEDGRNASSFVSSRSPTFGDGGGGGGGQRDMVTTPRWQEAVLRRASAINSRISQSFSSLLRPAFIGGWSLVPSCSHRRTDFGDAFFAAVIRSALALSIDG